jgi:hypothetical protein
VQVQVILRPTVSRPVHLGVGPLLGKMTKFYTSLSNNCFFFSSCRAPSLTRGRSNLQCSHAQVIVAQDPYPYINVSSETAPTWRARSPYLYPPGTGWPSYTPRHGFTCTFKFKFKFKLYSDRRSVGQFILVSDPLWGRWPDFNFLCFTITFFLLHVGRPLRRENWSAICSAITHWWESRRTHNHILLSHLRLSQPGGPGSLTHIPLVTG